MPIDVGHGELAGATADDEKKQWITVDKAGPITMRVQHPEANMAGVVVLHVALL
jgi:hypothetical protein